MRLILSVKVDAAGHCSWQDESPSLPDDDSEQRLIDRLRSGERDALERMIIEHRPLVTGLVSRLTGWSSDTEDLVQEVFVNALRGAKRFRGHSRISTWLARIAINVCRSYHRKRLFGTAFWRRWREQLTDQPLASDASFPTEQSETAKRVGEAVRRLSPKYREVVVLHYLQAMPTNQIQELLGISRNTVEVRLHRARKMLQELLGDLKRE